MAYVVTNTRGQIVAVVQDGTINTTATSQTLVGKNVTPYGEYEVENLVKQLENFANTTPPGNPIEGQFWYDTVNDAPFVYVGNGWKPVSGMTASTSEPTLDPKPGDLWFNPTQQQIKVYSPNSTGFGWLPLSKVTVASSAPTAEVSGELYFNSATKQLFAWDGLQWNLIGPEGVAGFATTRWISTTLFDIFETEHAVIIGYVGGNAIAIISTDTFTILASQRPSGFERLVPGINMSVGNVLAGRATNADQLTTARTINGVPFDGTQNITIGNQGELIAGPGLVGTAYSGTVPQTWSVDATSALVASKIVSRDVAGGFSAGTINANLVGNVTGLATNVTGVVGAGNGGTGFSNYSFGQILIGNPSGGLFKGNVRGDGVIAVNTDSVTNDIVVSYTGGTGSGSVQSVNITAGEGIGVSGGPITSSGAITVTNAGVTRLNAGTGVSVDRSNGNVTITNTGVTSLVPGSNISLSANQGAVIISATAGVSRIIAGTNVSISPPDGLGAVVINSTGGGGSGTTLVLAEKAGTVKLWAGTTPPDGWFLCDGSAVSRTIYSTLFSRIGTNYGPGNGSTTFNLPDLRSRFARGVNSGSPGTTGGSANAVVVSHNHTGTVNGSTNSAGTHSHRIRSGAGGGGTDPLYADGRNGLAGMNFNGPYNLYSDANPMVEAAGSHDHAFSGSFTTSSSGESGTNKNLPPYQELNYIIKQFDTDTPASPAVVGDSVELAGSIKMWPSTLVPQDWAACDGRELSRSAYAALFQRIGTTYGSGNGVSTFNIPDFRGRFGIGAADSYPPGARGGSADAVVVSHRHTFTGSGFEGTTSSAGAHQHDSSWGERPESATAPFGTSGRTGAAGSGRTDFDNLGWLTSSAGSHKHTIEGTPSGTISTTGESGTNKNLPPYLSATWIIKLTDNATTGSAAPNAAPTNLGTVRQITAGDGLTGGTITDTGTIAVDSTVLRTNAAQDVSGLKRFTGGIISQAYNLTDTGNSIFYTGPGRGAEVSTITVAVDTTYSNYFYPQRFVCEGNSDGRPGERQRGGTIVGIDNGVLGGAGVWGITTSNVPGLGQGINGTATGAAFTGACLQTSANRGISTQYLHMRAYSAASPVFFVNGQGDVTARSFSPSGADYAEYFEWLDGNVNNEDRIGMSVSLEGDKIRLAREGDELLGVVSAHPAMAGDSADLYWKHQYLLDDFGRQIMENYHVWEWTDPDGKRQSIASFDVTRKTKIPANAVKIELDADGNALQRAKPNPAFDPNQKYIPRSQRREWSPIGLIGKLRLRRGQPTAPSWIKLRDISATVEEWLVK